MVITPTHTHRAITLDSVTRVVCLTNRSTESKGSAAVASFTCEEEIVSCYVTVSMATVHAVALTEEGVLHMFKYPLTNQVAAPISAHSRLQFATEPSKQVHRYTQ